VNTSEREHRAYHDALLMAPKYYQNRPPNAQLARDLLAMGYHMWKLNHKGGDFPGYLEECRADLKKDRDEYLERATKIELKKMDAQDVAEAERANLARDARERTFLPTINAEDRDTWNTIKVPSLDGGAVDYDPKDAIPARSGEWCGSFEATRKHLINKSLNYSYEKTLLNKKDEPIARITIGVHLR